MVTIWCRSFATILNGIIVKVEQAANIGVFQTESDIDFVDIMMAL